MHGAMRETTHRLYYVWRYAVSIEGGVHKAVTDYGHQSPWFGIG